MADKDTVKVKFQIDPDGAGTQALHEKDRLVQEIAQHFESLGQKLPLAQMRQLATFGVSALQQIRTEVLGMNQAFQQFNANKVLDELIKVGGQTKSERELVNSLRTEFLALGVDLPIGKFEELGITGSKELRVILDQARLLRSEVDANAEALRGLQRIQDTSPITPGRGQAPLGGQFDVRGTGRTGPTPVPANIQDIAAAEAIAASVSSTTRRTQDLSIANESLRGRFEAAARAGKDGYDSIGRAADKAAANGRVFSGTTYVGTQLLRSFGVEGSRAIEVVGRQFLDLGLTLEDLAKSKLFLATLGVAAGIAVGEITEAITGGIRRVSEFQRTAQENFVRVTRTGLTGTVAEVESDLKRLEEFQKSAQFFEARGDASRADALRRRAISGRGSEEEIAKAQVEFERSGGRNVGFFAGLFSLGQKAQEDVAQKFAALTRLQGGETSPEQLAKRIQDASKVALDFERSLIGTGKKNIFDEADDSLKRLLQTSNREVRSLLRAQDLSDVNKKSLAGFDPGQQSKELTDFITSLSQKQGVTERVVQAFSQNGQSGFRFADKVVERFLTPSEIKERIELYQKGLEKNKEFLGSLKQLEQDINSEFGAENKLRDSIEQARKSIESLKIQAEDDPLTKLITQAEERTREFLQRIKDFPRELQGELRSAFQASNSKLELRDLFNLELGQGTRDQKLLGDIARLQAGVGTNTAGITEEDRQRLAFGRLQDARILGDRGATRVAQAALISKQAELEEQIRQARSGRQFGRAAELENQLGALGRETVGSNLERQLRESELTALRDRLNQTTSLPQQVFILDKILEATSKVGDLSEEQRDFRLKALQQRLSIGEAERHRVLIEIKNTTDNVQTTVDQELGPNSGSAASNFSPVGGGSTSPFGGDFDAVNGGF